MSKAGLLSAGSMSYIITRAYVYHDMQTDFNKFEYAKLRPFMGQQREGRT